MSYPDLRSNHNFNQDESFWPSFTDIMMVIVMIFVVTAVVLVSENFNLEKTVQDQEAQIINVLELSTEALDELSSNEEQIAFLVKQITLLRDASLEDAKLRNALNTQIEAKNQQIESQALKLAETTTATQQYQRTLRQKQQDVAELTKIIEGLNSGVLRLELSLETERQVTQETTKNHQVLLATLNTKKLALAQTNRQLQSTQQRLDEKEIALKSVQDALAQASEKLDADASAVTKVTEEMTAKLANLTQRYDSLKRDYDKLILPARSAKGKFVANVYLPDSEQSQDFAFKPDGGVLVSDMRWETLEQELAALQQQFGNKLYVRIITPDSSTITQARSWRLTNDLLNKYDYYYQTNAPGSFGNQAGN